VDTAEESDRGVVPENFLNKAATAAAEEREGRLRIKENIVEDQTGPAQNGKRMSQGLSGVRRVAKERKQERFTTLLHHVTVDLLRESFASLKKQAAPGVDGVTWQEYEQGLEDRLVDLHGRIHRGAYRAQPSRRVYIPKADGRQRPLGIAALEDKIVQQAVVSVLNEIYEVDFRGFSYGFRPGRGPHRALDALAVGIERKRVNWILDADIRSFFDQISHEWMLKFVEHRIADRRILRLIQKWLTAGVSENGEWSKTKIGTPQGSVISPLLADIYLHYVFDVWIEAWRKKTARGDVLVVRYADDLVVGFEHQDEAERFLTAFQERLRHFGLEVHDEKTRLIEFGRHAAVRRKMRGEGKPETFTFLGFTHICRQRKSDGSFVVWRETASKRLRAALTRIRLALRERMHEPVAQTGLWLRRVVQGYFLYHGVPGNWPSMSLFRHRICKLWWHTLNRRSQRGRVTGTYLRQLTDYWLPPVRLHHPYPHARFDATHPR
jgi:RNA-directed DNA polymerase